MMRTVVLFAGLCALAAPMSASAAAGAWEVGVSAGLAYPVGNFAESSFGYDAKRGIALNMDVGYQVTERVAIGIDGGYNRNEREGSQARGPSGEIIEPDKDRFLIWHVGAHARFPALTHGKFVPYGVLGMGVYHLENDFQYTIPGFGVFTDNNISQPGSRPGGRIGLGVELLASEGIAVGVESDYNYISIDKDRFGVSSLAFVGVRAGLRYHTSK